ncbi:MAG TPA: MFS transporter [Methanothrix sp.]|nr:MFS transporter [Methanothrix sp.]HQJ80095.1 MFS transporter [Methanothrix sp.]
MIEKSQPRLAVIGSCLAVFWSGALTFGFPGAMSPLWQEMFGVGAAATGLIIFFMLAAVGVFMFLVGRWQEHWGLQSMMALGVILTAAGSSLASLASNIQTIYAWAALNGMASCFLYVPALTLVQWCYPGKRGLAAGTVSMVFGLAAAVTSPLFGLMLSAWGYEAMNLALAGLTLGMGLFGAYLARPPPAWFEAIAARKSAKAKQDEPLKAAEKGGGSLKLLAARSFTVSESLHTRSFWMLWLTWTLAGAAGVSMTILATGYGLYLGLPLSSAVLLLTSFNLTNGISRLASGMLSDRFGRRQVMSLAFLASSLAYLLLTQAEGLLSCALLAAVVGFSFGTLFSVSAPLVADCFGLEHFGAIFGLAFAAYGFVAGPLGPTLSGYLLDITGNDYTLVFSYLGLFFLLASACIRQVMPPLRS